MRAFIATLLLLIAVSADARDPAKVREFRKTHPCPVTGKTTGACPKYVVDHGIPLCLGGADEPYNMFWQAKADSYRKDVDERRLCRQYRACIK
jgi:hypothetical protein